MIQEFLQYQATNKGLAEQTIEGYRKELRAFINWAQPKGLRWSILTREDMDNYVSDQVKQGLQPRTIRRRVEVVRLLLRWAGQQGILYNEAARFTQTPKIADELPKEADAQGLIRFLDAEPTDRNMMYTQVVASLILETGLRIGEALAMRGEDIDTANQSIKVRGKGNKGRIVFYGQRSRRWASIWSQRKGQIFQVTAVQLRFWLIRYASPYCPGIHPHAIRHTFAINQLNGGMELKTLATLMGHQHVTTTEIYTRCLTDKLHSDYQQANS